MWPSKNPDDYLAGPRLKVPSDTELPSPPYWILMSISLTGAGLIVLLAAAAGGLRPSSCIWTVVAGTWVMRSQVTRWWADTRGDRTVSWRPAASFAGIATLSGLATAPILHSRHDRALAVYLALLIAWTGSDLLDWLLRRRRARRALATQPA